METTETTTRTGTQPLWKRKKWRVALPSAPAKPSTRIWKKMKKLATLEPDAMKAALGVGAPW